MDQKLFRMPALSAVALFAAAVASPVQATYVCTGAAVGSAAGNPFFNGDLLDTAGNCGIAELEIALGVISIDIGTLVGSKTNSVGDPIVSWDQDEFGLGTLDVTTWTQTSGTWELTGSIMPLFYVEKYDQGYDLYTYMGGSMSPFSDSWDGATRGTIGEPCRTTGGGPPVGDVNCKATTSHISVYYAETVVPVPAAVWLFGSGLLGLVGIARRHRS